MGGRVSYYGGIVTDGLVFDLDAAKRDSYPGTGTVWRDIKTNIITGTLVNGPTFDPNNGGSIVFDGIDDTTNFGDILDLGTNNATINIWLKINSSWSSGIRCSISKAFFGVQNFRYAILFSQTRQLMAFLQGNGGLDITPTTNAILNLNQWYMCTMVINRSSIIELYINGELQTVFGNAVISQWNGLNFQSNNPFRVGSYTFNDNVSPNLNFPGNISIVEMYFKSLTSQEILQNFNATKGRFGL
jgi:hypothetical protein